MASIFSKIIAGEIPCYKIAEDTDYFAFLDVRPLKRGHTLIVPKKEIDYLFDLDEETYIGLHVFAKKVATALKAAVPCKRIGTAVIGLEVPHCHIHLIPMDTVSDINFDSPKLTLPPDMMEETARAIRSFL